MKFHDFLSARQRTVHDFNFQLASNESAVMGVSFDAYANALRRELAWVKQQSNVEFLTTHALDDVDRAVAPGEWRDKIMGDLVRSRIGVLMEYEWYNTERPFYNVYPIVEQLIRNTKLDVSAAFLNFPYRTMLFRFAVGHEPYGIKSVLITVGQPHVVPKNTKYFTRDNVDIFAGVIGSALVEHTKPIPGEHHFHDVYLLSGLYEEVPAVDDRPYEQHFLLHNSPESIKAFNNIARKYQALQSPDELMLRVGNQHQFSSVADKFINSSDKPCRLQTIERTIRSQHDREMWQSERAPLYMGYQSLDVHQFVFKLAAFVSMLHKGADLITPIVLTKHQEKYDSSLDEAAKKWLEDKAAQIQGRGFAIGKTLNEQSAVSPHLRNSHMALYWTGPGRTEPKLILRSGSVVMPKHLSQVPSGFLGDETTIEVLQESANNDNNTALEHVYFLLDSTANYIKIGRTKRAVEARRRESKTFVPGGLRLIGYISTGDSVALETRLHREYAHKRRDNEFFALSLDEAHTIIESFGGTHCTSDN